MPRFKVCDELTTVQYIIDHKVGIARFGDGEYKLALNKKIKSQNADPKLAGKLKKILVGENKKCIVGIPNMYNGIHALAGTKAHHFWTHMEARRIYDTLLDPNKQYYSSFITRPDNAPIINNIDYFNLCKLMWDKRDVVIITGESIRFCKNESLLDNCNIIGEVVGPSTGAFSDYARIINSCLEYPKDTLFLARLGPTATALAWDLGVHDYQCLDLGHFGMFYTRLLKRQEDYIDYDNSKTHQ